MAHNPEKPKSISLAEKEAVVTRLTEFIPFLSEKAGIKGLTANYDTPGLNIMVGMGAPLDPSNDTLSACVTAFQKVYELHEIGTGDAYYISKNSANDIRIDVDTSYHRWEIGEDGQLFSEDSHQKWPNFHDYP